jgi:hypothetical protein
MIQGETPMKRKATRTRDGIDWLAVAIARMGGPKGAARKLKVPRREEREWFTGEKPYPQKAAAA